MVGKRPRSPSDRGNKPKRARKAITLQTKLDVLKKADEGMRLKDLQNLFGLAASTVATIKKERENIMASAKTATPLSAKLVTKHRPAIMEDMERLLALWIDDMRDREDSPMTNIAMQEKARSLFEDLVQKDIERAGPSGSVDHPSFTASKGWLERFKQRFNFHTITQSGEAASADKEAAKAYHATLLNIIEEGGYSDQQVFNFDETGLYWKRMPKKTVISKEETKAPGHKPSKVRLTLLLGGNAAGDFAMKPLLIHFSENPRALKNHAKSTLPVIYKHSRKAWMNRIIFQDWFTNYFAPAVKKYCAEKNIAHKALLLLDNAPAHPVNLSDLSEHIRVEYLPKNTTSLLQPMDQGVIATFKAYYLRRTFRRMIRAVDSDRNLSILQFWKDFNIKDGIDMIAESWKEMKQSTMNAVWKKLWPECVNNFTGFPNVKPVVTDIVNIAHGAGMNEVDEEGVNEVLESHGEELSNEDLMAIEQERAADEEKDDEDTTPQLHLTRNILADALSEIEKGIQKIVDNDPNRERSLKLEHSIENVLAPYKALHQEKILQARQSRMTSFFKPKSQQADATPSTSVVNAAPSTSVVDVAPSTSVVDAAPSTSVVHAAPSISASTIGQDDVSFTSDEAYEFTGFTECNEDDEDIDSPKAYSSTPPSSPLTSSAASPTHTQ